MSQSPYRNMRLILMFDLPSSEDYEKKEYLIFRKALIKNGYSMMQFSIYIKPVNFQSKVNQEIERLKKFIPRNGNIRIIQVTEKQYANMYMLLGNKKINEIYNNSKRYVKI
ncbi:MAG: CRISPR-associated endonuclease Cas2 [Mycoplasmoidaceae bacterium]